MADYINKNILCQAYIHVEPDDISDEIAQALKIHLTEFVKSRGDFFLYPNPDVEIEVKEGSLKVYATIVGTVAAALYTGVANYPTFREGAIVLYEDAKRLSEYIAAEGLFATRARHTQVIRVEARTGVIGSIKKIVAAFDALKAMDGTVTADKQLAKLKEIDEDIDKLMDNLKSQEDIELVKNGLLEIAGDAPQKPSDPPRKRSHPMDVIRYRNLLKAVKSKLS
ncbi:MAG: hypothetical protein AB7Q04_13950 [Steroidobacteraceae bacterium]